MKGMLKAEFFKFCHSYSLWIILGVLVASCSISIIAGTYSSAEITLANLCKDSMVPILACAIYSAIILTDDFSNGLLRLYVANGYKRMSIIFAKFFHYMFGCSILLLIYPFICITLAAIIQGIETTFLSVLGTMLVTFIKQLPLYLGIFALFFLFSFLIQKGVIVIGVSVSTSILLVVFTNKFYESATSILKYSPMIQMNEVLQNTGKTYFISAALSIIVLIFCLCGSIMKFNHHQL